jgi:hypothetical protein
MKERERGKDAHHLGSAPAMREEEDERRRKRGGVGVRGTNKGGRGTVRGRQSYIASVICLVLVPRRLADGEKEEDGAKVEETRSWKGNTAAAAAHTTGRSPAHNTWLSWLAPPTAPRAKPSFSWLLFGVLLEDRMITARKSSLLFLSTARKAPQ